MRWIATGFRLLALVALPLASATMRVPADPTMPGTHHRSSGAKHVPSVTMAPLPDAEPTLVTSTKGGESFHPIPVHGPLVDDLVDKFMKMYKTEVKHTALNAISLSVLKAEKTNVREELQEKELDANGLGVDFVEEAQTQQYRVLLLMKYQFRSAMLDAKRPYVSVMRLTMDCFNTTAPDDSLELACDVLEHFDLPRRNESTKAVPAFIQRQIFHSTPKAYVHNHTLNVAYDAVEAQDLVFDRQGRPVPNRDTMHYVRFRVEGAANAQDCMVVVEYVEGVSTLRYQDDVCYSDLASVAAAAAAKGNSHFRLTKDNLPMFILIASVAGALVALGVIWRQRRHQRSGYSYVHSNNSKLGHLPGSSATEDAAVAC